MLKIVPKPIVDKDNRYIQIWNEDRKEYEVHTFEFVEYLYDLVKEDFKDHRESEEITDGVSDNEWMSESVYPKEIVIGKEYEIQHRFAIVEKVVGKTACCRDRWDFYFECDVGEVKEKKLPKLC